MTTDYGNERSSLKIDAPRKDRMFKVKIFVFIVLMVTLALNVAPIMATPEPASPVSSPTPQSESTLVFKAEADAKVAEHKPTENTGTSDYLEAALENSRSVESYIRFTVSEIPAEIQSARLRVYSTTDTSNNGPALYTADNNWNETEIAWNNRPARLGDILDNKDVTRRYTWVEYDVTSLIKGDGVYSFVLVGDSSDIARFASRESSNGPQLAITLASDAAPPTLTPAPTTPPTASPVVSTDPVLVGAGDIATCNQDNDELTAQLLDNIPGTVFTIGDNAYKDGTSTEFANCYDSSWGRHKSRTMPVPGNHDYNTSEAAGYFEYFDDVPAYYAYDLGSWRIYALNSEIDASASSPQVVWLQEDLAANPRQCVLAIWHRPRWSSGEKHGDNPEIQTLWQIFYNAGAELVLNGHEHNYERFAEMNELGVETSPGLREFIVGTGGAGLYPFKEAPLPTSQMRDDTTFGVLKLTLHATSYDWEFVPIPGSTFTDSGSSNCH